MPTKQKSKSPTETASSESNMPSWKEVSKLIADPAQPKLQKMKATKLTVGLPFNLGTLDFEPDDAVERLSQANPAKIQEIAASQIELLTIYHKVVIYQAQRSFLWALIAAAVGLVFFIAAIAFQLLQQPESTATISVISGALIEVISAINFYLYNKASAQLAEFQNRLDITQRFLLANSMCESLEGKYKQQSRAELVRAIVGIDSRLANILSKSNEQIDSAD